MEAPLLTDAPLAPINQLPVYNPHLQVLQRLNPGDIDVRPILTVIKRRWYVVLAAVLVFMALAIFYVKISPNIFAAKTSIYVSDQSTGSEKTQELLDMLDGIKQRNIDVDDEIGLMKSYSIVQKTMERLDFAVSYFEIEKNIFNKFGDFQVRERYKDFPFRVVINPAANQVVGAKIYIRLLSADKVEMHVVGEDVRVFNLQTRELVKKADELDYTKQIPVGVPYSDEYVNFKLMVNAGQVAKSENKYYFVINDLNSLTTQYMSKIEAKPLARESRIVEITSEGPIVEKEIKFLNTLVDVLTEYDLSEKNKTGIRTLQFLDGQLSKVGDSLRNAESRLSTFRSVNKVLNVNEATQSVYQRLDQLETEKARLDVQAKYYQNVLNSLQGEQTLTDVVSPSTLGIENQILNNLLIELVTLNRQLAGMAVMAKKDAPNVRILESKIDNAKAGVLENLSNNLGATRIATQEVNRRIAELEGNIYKMPENERRLQDLQGKSDFNSRTYNFMLEKRAEAAVTLAANTPDMKRVDDAKMVGSGPIAPKSKQMYLIAIILGIFLPSAALVFLDRVDNTIRSKEQLESLSPIPFLGIITDAGKGHKLPVIDKPLSAISESFRSLRINLQYLAAGMDKKVIGVTSSISGEGKTFCSANIAAELAHSGKRVVLIEADLRRPTLSKYFTLDTKVGLSSYLIKASTLTETIQATNVKNLDVISSGPIPPNPVELVSLPAMGELLAELRKRYDYIVMDIPPIGFVSEYFVLLRHLDANLFVTRYGYTSRQLLSSINALYAEGKINHLYMVLNGLNYYEKYEYRNKGEKYYRS